MKKYLIALVLLATSLCMSLPSHAAAGLVEGVQSPAWLERDGLAIPLNVGMDLAVGDLVRTGNGSRALLKLPEGSLVKLGENAQFRIEASKPQGGIFTAALNVVQGAFRFTTQAFAKSQKRDVRIRVANNATIGIRGTDLWGRSRDDKDIVCLIEGKIDITGNDNKTSRLDQPLQLFQSTRTAPPEPLSSLDPALLPGFAAETEIEAGKGASTKGEWKLVYGSFASRDSVLTVNRRLRAEGFPAEPAAGNTIQIAHLSGEAEANELAARIATATGYKDAKVMK